MLLMDEGECNAKLKALNAEKAGAKMLVIIQEKEGTLMEQNHDMTGMMVEIPTVTVDKAQGEKLKSLISQ